MTVTDLTVHALDARGTIRDWLVVPAWGWPCDDLADHLSADGSPWGPADGTARWVLTNGPDVAGLKARLHAAHPLSGTTVMGEPLVGGLVTVTGPDAVARQSPRSPGALRAGFDPLGERDVWRCCSWVPRPRRRVRLRRRPATPR